MLISPQLYNREGSLVFGCIETSAAAARNKMLFQSFEDLSLFVGYDLQIKSKSAADLLLLAVRNFNCQNKVIQENLSS